MNKETRYFQWIIGDRKDQICIFDHIETDDGNVYIVFTDKSRINESLVAQLNQTDLTGKYMAEIDHPNNKWTHNEEWVGRQEEKWEWRDETNPTEKVCVQPFVEGKKVVKLIPPNKTPPRSSSFGVISNSQMPIYQDPLPPPPPSKSQVDKTDPVYILMSKSKKQDIEISMNISISLPPKNLYDIAKESFDEGEKKFVEYIIQEITVEEIKESLRTAITEMYETPIIVNSTI